MAPGMMVCSSCIPEKGLTLSQTWFLQIEEQHKSYSALQLARCTTYDLTRAQCSPAQHLMTFQTFLNGSLTTIAGAVFVDGHGCICGIDLSSLHSTSYW